MPDHTINVVAHLVFGMRTLLVEAQGEAGGGVDPRFDPQGRQRRTRQLVRMRDSDHGTKRSAADINALFIRDPSYEYPSNNTINDIFAGAGLRFRLTSIHETLVENHIAEFATEGDVVSTARRHNRSDAINIYFFKRIQGAYGVAVHYMETSDLFFAAVADDLNTNSPVDHFKRTVATTAHELGHVCGLPHMLLNLENVMTTGGFHGRINLTKVQEDILNARGRALATEVELVDIGLIHLQEERHQGREWHFEPNEFDQEQS